MFLERKLTDSEFAILRAPLLSQKMGKGRGTGKPMETMKYRIDKVSRMASDMYSASVEDSATVRCLTDDHETRLQQMKMHNPTHVDESEAQSAATAPKSLGNNAYPIK